MNTETAITIKPPVPEYVIKKVDGLFVPLNSSISIHAREVLGNAGGAAFRTTIARSLLTAAFLDNLPEEYRKQYTCRCCLDFLEKWGDLAIIEPRSFKVISVFWSGGDDVPEPFTKSIAAMAKIVEKATVEKAFYFDTISDVLGEKSKGKFHHFYMFGLPIKKGKDMMISASANGNVSIQEHTNLRKMVLAYPARSLEFLATHFQNDQRLRGYSIYEKRVQWLWDLRESWDANKNPNARDNMLWLQVSTATPDLLNLDNGAVEPLLIASITGNDMDGAIRSFRSHTNPENHMRPTEAPSEGTLENAKKIVEKLGIEPSFYRRAARLDEFPIAWTPKKAIEPEAAKPASFLDSIKTKAPVSVMPAPSYAQFSGGTMTLSRFEEDILPNVDTMSIFLAPGRSYNFVSAATALHADAPPILRYDSVEKRLPLSLFARGANGSIPSAWGTESNQNLEVTAIIDFAGEMAPLAGTAGGRLYVLDTMAPDKGTKMALFPALMRPELHHVRSVVEAFSSSNDMHEIENGFVGVFFHPDSMCDVSITVTKGDVKTMYRIDRSR